MRFKDRIPEAALQGGSSERFVDLLDALNDYKFSEISKSVKLHNPVLFLDRKWMAMQLGDYGVYVPETLPVQVLQQYLLNVDTITGLRGSKAGIALWLSVISLGEAIVDDSNFYGFPTFLLLDSNVQGSLPSDSEDVGYFLVSDSSHLTPPTSLTLEVRSRYFNGSYPEESKVIRDYIQSNIKSQIGFSEGTVINLTFATRAEFYYHPLLNNYYV